MVPPGKMTKTSVSGIVFAMLTSIFQMSTGEEIVQEGQEVGVVGELYSQS